MNGNEPFFLERYHKAFNMREVIMHAQPSSETMRLNAACISGLLHIVDNIVCSFYICSTEANSYM